MPPRVRSRQAGELSEGHSKSQRPDDCGKSVPLTQPTLQNRIARPEKSLDSPRKSPRFRRRCPVVSPPATPSRNVRLIVNPDNAGPAAKVSTRPAKSHRAAPASLHVGPRHGRAAAPKGPTIEIGQGPRGIPSPFRSSRVRSSRVGLDFDTLGRCQVRCPRPVELAALV